MGLVLRVVQYLGSTWCSKLCKLWPFIFCVFCPIVFECPVHRHSFNVDCSIFSKVLQIEIKYEVVAYLWLIRVSISFIFKIVNKFNQENVVFERYILMCILSHSIRMAWLQAFLICGLDIIGWLQVELPWTQNQMVLQACTSKESLLLSDYIHQISINMINLV